MLSRTGLQGGIDRPVLQGEHIAHWEFGPAGGHPGGAEAKDFGLRAKSFTDLRKQQAENAKKMRDTAAARSAARSLPRCRSRQELETERKSLRNTNRKLRSKVHSSHVILPLTVLS